MTDRYRSLVHTPLGRRLVKQLGLPRPVELERYHEGEPLVDGVVLLGGSGGLRDAAAAALDELGIAHAETATEGERYKGLVFDATGIDSSARLVELQRFFTPLLRRLRSCPRVVVLGTPPELAEDNGRRVAQRALEGFTRSLGKEIGRGGTVQLVYVAPADSSGAGAGGGSDASGSGGAGGSGGQERPGLTSTLAFLLSPKSAYVSGQVIRVGGGATDADGTVDWTRPLAGRVAVVTGASRGIGAEIARVLHRDGAAVLGVDVPQAASELMDGMDGIDGDHLVLDITAADAPQRIARHVKDSYGGVDVVVHNAGVTRDRRLVNMKEDRFASTVAVNLTAPERITEELLAQGLLRPNGRIIGVASVAGLAGNVGQTNYATSKAGVVGLVDALAGRLPDGITANAVAPGFIETTMTAAVPLLTREVGRRLNALAQAGLPVDVAETVAWLASPASSQVDGNVVRVCGQMLMGA